MPPQGVEWEFNTFSLPSGAHGGAAPTYQSKNLERKCQHRPSQNFLLIPINEPPPLRVLPLRSDEDVQEQSWRGIKKRENDCTAPGPLAVNRFCCIMELTLLLWLTLVSVLVPPLPSEAALKVDPPKRKRLFTAFNQLFYLDSNGGFC